MTHQKLFDHMSQEHGLTLTESEMIEIELVCSNKYTPQEKMLTGLYNLSKIARELWPGMNDASAKAKLHNKLNHTQGQRFTDNEIERLRIILK